MEHLIAVGFLKKLLEPLDDELVLVPNMVGNLAIFNQAGKFLGFVDLLEHCQEIIWLEDKDEKNDT